MIVRSRAFDIEGFQCRAIYAWDVFSVKSIKVFNRLIPFFPWPQVQRLREKILEQEAEHIKLVEENNKLKHDRQIAVSSVIVLVIVTSIHCRSALTGVKK